VKLVCMRVGHLKQHVLNGIKVLEGGWSLVEMRELKGLGHKETV